VGDLIVIEGIKTGVNGLEVEASMVLFADGATISIRGIFRIGELAIAVASLGSGVDEANVGILIEIDGMILVTRLSSFSSDVDTFGDRTGWNDGSLIVIV
jgi:hypothetical protein